MARYWFAIEWWKVDGHFNKDLYERFLDIRYAEK